MYKPRRSVVGHIQPQEVDEVKNRFGQNKPKPADQKIVDIDQNVGPLSLTIGFCFRLHVDIIVSLARNVLHVVESVSEESLPGPPRGLRSV